jgi:hypothetical protein
VLTWLTSSLSSASLASVSFLANSNLDIANCRSSSFFCLASASFSRCSIRVWSVSTIRRSESRRRCNSSTCARAASFKLVCSARLLRVVVRTSACFSSSTFFDLITSSSIFTLALAWFSWSRSVSGLICEFASGCCHKLRGRAENVMRRLKGIWWGYWAKI